MTRVPGDRTAVDFLHDLGYRDLPVEVGTQAARCLLDLVAVAAAGSATELSSVVRGFAARHLGGRDHTSRLWFDGRPVSQPGAALANAATIDAMDGHDGHRLTKGHAGAAVLPAAVATLEPLDTTSTEELLVALVVGYEIATRAGIALHATATDYHSSGAWNALGAAAVAARALRLDAPSTSHALGIAEYHGPRGPMMRGIDHPTMVKDSSGWGAHAGVSAALLAAAGFTGAPAELVYAGAGCWHDLGRRWRIMEQYRKPHPVCRWAHPAIEAVLRVVGLADVDPRAIRRIEISTFGAATRLAAGFPATTEIAQYSLPFPVALAAVHGAVPAAMIANPEQACDLVRRLTGATVVTESPELTAAFPARRRAEATVELASGARLASGPTTAPGDPELPLTDDVLLAKFDSLATPVLGGRRANDLRATLLAMPRGSLAEFLAALAEPR